MSNGKPWTEADTATLERMAGRPDAEIAAAVGRSLRQVQDHRRARGIKAFVQRLGWSRRDWLLHDAAGLDFSL